MKLKIGLVGLLIVLVVVLVLARPRPDPSREGFDSDDTLIGMIVGLSLILGVPMLGAISEASRHASRSSNSSNSGTRA